MKSYDGLDFRSVEAGLANVPGYSDLHPVRKRRLALLLIKSRWVFDYFHGQDTTLSPKTSAAKLKNLLGSLSLLSNFARGAGIDPSNRDVEVDPACRDAMLRLLWTADIQGPNERQSVMNLLFASSTVYKVAREAERAMRLHIREKEAESAIVWLCGRRLPEIYHKIFGAKFTTSRGKNPAIGFVQAALQTIKVRGEISDETIISHYKAAHKG